MDVVVVAVARADVADAAIAVSAAVEAVCDLPYYCVLYSSLLLSSLCTSSSCVRIISGGRRRGCGREVEREHEFQQRR